MNYSVANFRKNMREAFDRAEKGETVYVKRHDRVFTIMVVKTGEDVIHIPFQKKSDLPDGKEPRHFGGEINAMRPEKKDVHAIEDEFAEALDAAEQDCCRGKSPCKHWIWSPERVCYINTLSGNTREADE